ncbi:SH2 domain protein [Trichuris suis]|nr:SH2 domain protein [Trichuris suis]
MLEVGFKEVDFRPISNALAVFGEKYGRVSATAQIFSQQEERCAQIDNGIAHPNETSYQELPPFAKCRAKMPERIEDNYWYHGSIDRSRAEALVLYSGHFLVRDSCTRNDEYVITCNWQGCPTHFPIVRSSTQPNTIYERVVYKVEDETFDSVPALIRFYVGNKKPLTRSSHCIISCPVNRPPGSSLTKANNLSAEKSISRDSGIYQSSAGSSAKNISIPELPAYMRNRPLPKLPCQLPSLDRTKWSSEMMLTRTGKRLALNASDRDLARRPNFDEANQPPPKPTVAPSMKHDGMVIVRSTGGNFEALPAKDFDDYHEYCDIDYDELSLTPVNDHPADMSRECVSPKLPARKQHIERDSACDVDMSIYDQPTSSKLVDIETIKVRLSSRINVKAYKSNRLPDDVKPMDSRVWPAIRKDLLEADASDLARCITSADRHLLTSNQAEKFHPLIPCDLSLLLLPQGESMRNDLKEKATCLKHFVQMSILSADTLLDRIKMMTKWIEVADQLRNKLGNLFSFSSVMAALGSRQLASLNSHWFHLRSEHTHVALLYETKLRSLYVCRRDSAENGTFVPSIPDLWTVLRLFEADPRKGDTLHDLADPDDQFYGLETLWDELVATRQWQCEVKNLFAEFPTRNDVQHAGEKDAVPSALRELFETEFHIKALWGAKASLVQSKERYDKLDDLLSLLAQRRESELTDQFKSLAT